VRKRTKGLRRSRGWHSRDEKSCRSVQGISTAFCLTEAMSLRRALGASSRPEHADGNDVVDSAPGRRPYSQKRKICSVDAAVPAVFGGKLLLRGLRLVGRQRSPFAASFVLHGSRPALPGRQRQFSSWFCRLFCADTLGGKDLSAADRWAVDRRRSQSRIDLSLRWFGALWSIGLHKGLHARPGTGLRSN
jgi:hypothetical protein